MDSSNNFKKLLEDNNNTESAFTKKNVKSNDYDVTNQQNYTKYFQNRNTISMAANSNFTRNFFRTNNVTLNNNATEELNK